MEFKTYIFIKDEEGTKRKRKISRRTYLLGIISLLIGVVFIILNDGLATFIFISLGSILTGVGKLILAFTKDKGKMPANLLITDSEIIISNKTFRIDELKELSFNLVNYKGGPTMDQFKIPEGNENEISFLQDGKIVKLNFLIQTIKYYKDLIDFFEERKINYKAIKGFPWM